MAEWALFVATVVIQLLGLAFFYGVAWQKIKGHDAGLKWVGDKFEKLETEQDARWVTIAGEQKDQWEQINDSRENIGKIKGRLGLNGA